MHESPEVAILQHSSGVMQVVHNMFENGSKSPISTPINFPSLTLISHLFHQHHLYRHQIRRRNRRRRPIRRTQRLPPLESLAKHRLRGPLRR